MARLNSRGEVTGVPDRKGWNMILPYGMVAIPGGTFMMGQADEDITASNINSNRRITISPFYMDAYEVSNNKYRQFLVDVGLLDESGRPLDPNAGAGAGAGPVAAANPADPGARQPYEIPAGFDLMPNPEVWTKSFTNHYGDPLMNYYFEHPAFDDYPVVGVSWDQAQEFAKWRTIHLNNNKDAGKRGKTVEFDMPDFRLPSEAEWEYAAKGGKDIAKYPWGGPYMTNQNGCMLANFKSNRGNYIDDGYAYTAPVDAYLPNDYGLFNMAGNVAEWCEDAFNPKAEATNWDLDPVYKDVNEPKKMVRGGSWKDMSHFLQTSTRTYEYQDEQTAYIGFRCAMTYLGRSGADFGQ
nr:SUMF1/EgtB/PvdO family nonheme iron enzyme [Penaeicola halotolerans]